MIVMNFRIDEPYSGTKDQRSRLRGFTGLMIGRYINGIELRRPTASNRSRIEVDPENLKEIAMLKELTWTYVISAPSMAAHQHGQKCLIRELFATLHDAAL